MIPVLATSTLMAACSSYDPEHAAAQQRDYCVKLVAWQSARNAMLASASSVDASDWTNIHWPEADQADEAGSKAMDAAKVLDREDLDNSDSHNILHDTEKAVIDRNAVAEERAENYCTESGLADLVNGR
ncbi:hypothetical protein ABZ612_20475 [Streptomyces avermitilis]|uniref:hypothetical protein n=1 Tax=Streptomyces avermitilis TaxID=33903 RepID=UPI0033C55601